MTLTNPATARLRIPGAPLTGYDVDVNDAICRFVDKHQPCTEADLAEVFLPAPADGLNREHQRGLQLRLTYLVATGRLIKAVHRPSFSNRQARYLTPSTTP